MLLGALPAKWRPKFVTRFMFIVDSVLNIGLANILNTGEINLYCEAKSTGFAYGDYMIKISEDL